MCTPPDAALIKREWHTNHLYVMLQYLNDTKARENVKACAFYGCNLPEEITKLVAKYQFI